MVSSRPLPRVRFFWFPSIALVQMYNVVSLTAATSTENLQALDEVKDFCTTDLGRGGKQRWTYHILPENCRRH
ncbi:hypothetical protein JVU11DRAFT_2572 [Chiua virens]|nr:hypothetical protein JVU11DRAFT_2572 [Chiua virens]